MALTALIDAIETHSGTLTSIATIALVIATVFLVRATLQLANITNNQDKPCLIFDYIETKAPIEIADGVYSNDEFRKNIFVKNIGKGHAFKIKFEFYPLSGKTRNYSFDVIPSGDKKFLCTLDSLEFETSRISYYDINKIKGSQAPYSTTRDIQQIGKFQIRF